MGLFDGLFGNSEKTEQVSLSNLNQWFEAKVKGETRTLVVNSMEVLHPVNELIATLREDINHLGGLGYSDIDPRYNKIVRTAKPSYVKSMLQILDGLKFKGDEFDEIISYDKLLSERLDTIGKVNFGDGKFLVYAFQDQMKEIQAGCKKLLNAREQLNKILTSNTEITTLDSARRKYNEFIELDSRIDTIRLDTRRLKGEVDEGENKLMKLDLELEGLHESPQYTKLNVLNGRLGKVGADIQAIELRIHHCLSPLKAPLRKYGKRVSDPKLVKLITSIGEESVETFFSTPLDEVEHILNELEKACQSGSITVKDMPKTLKKIKAARLQLTHENQVKVSQLRDEANKIKGELDLMSLESSERKIVSEKHALEQSIEKTRQDLADAKGKMKALTNESPKLFEDLKSTMAALNVELTE